MTRQEELVWASMWAASLRHTQGRMQPEERVRFAKGEAFEAVELLRWFAEQVGESASEGDILLRQMAGEPDCFIRRRPEPRNGGVYIMCQHPQIEAADHCHRCAAFGGWPEEEER